MRSFYDLETWTDPQLLSVWFYMKCLKTNNVKYLRKKRIKTSMPDYKLTATSRINRERKCRSYLESTIAESHSCSSSQGKSLLYKY